MSSTITTTQGRAPWRPLFLQHIGLMSQPSFVLSTLHPVSASSPFPAVPRARTVIFRGMWASLPHNERNPAPRNPPVYESDLLALTTDARMDKALEIARPGAEAGATRTGTVAGAGTGVSSGGGGAVEAVFWAEEAATQWRLRGTAWVLGPDLETEGGRAVREAVGARMRRLSDGGSEAAGAEGEGGTAETAWSWAREVTAHFGNLSPAMRGSFRYPPPGTPTSVPPGQGLGLGQKVEDLEDEIARANFRVVVIVPTEVDRVDLADMDRPRRWLYAYREGQWDTLEVWP